MMMMYKLMLVQLKNQCYKRAAINPCLRYRDRATPLN